MKKSQLTNKNKSLIGLAIITVLVAGSIGWGVNSYAKEKEEQQQITEQEKQIDDVAKKVDALYLDDTKEFLAKDISKDKIEEVDKALQALKDEKILTKKITREIKEVASEWAYAEYMYDYQLSVERLLDTNGILREDANIQQVEELRKDLVDNTKKENFAKSFDPILKEALAQQTQITEATKQVNSLYTTAERKEIKANITWDNYNMAKASVGKVKQEKSKKDLTGGLKKAQDYLKAQDAEREAKAEATAKKEQASKDIAGNSNNNSSSSSNNNNATSSSGSSDSNTSGNSNSSSSKSSPSSSGSSKSSSSSSSKSSGSSSSSSKPSSPSSSSGSESSSKEKTWNGSKTDRGTMDSDSGRSWGTIEW
ncbi:toxin Cry1Ac domain D-VI-related protein [Listeria monocytogenes]|uniref:toxin Cry1Ac domain D-VI-related protein n=1 Tax=Listeria monocytogenes TaxID=1639 RepID=UPI000875418C|nr:toxin Cry1Ac domain D-VI-related protein [Listeria monocytogenes]OFH68324.1 hypothetical protein BJN14_11860 [Listeria monocytogenes]